METLVLRLHHVKSLREAYKWRHAVDYSGNCWVNKMIDTHYIPEGSTIEHLFVQLQYSALEKLKKNPELPVEIIAGKDFFCKSCKRAELMGFIPCRSFDLEDDFRNFKIGETYSAKELWNYIES